MEILTIVGAILNILNLLATFNPPSNVALEECQLTSTTTCVILKDGRVIQTVPRETKGEGNGE